MSSRGGCLFAGLRLSGISLGPEFCLREAPSLLLRSLVRSSQAVSSEVFLGFSTHTSHDHNLLFRLPILKGISSHRQEGASCQRIKGASNGTKAPTCCGTRRGV